MAVTKGTQFDWPRTFRSQVSIYNIDVFTGGRLSIILDILCKNGCSLNTLRNF